MDEAAEIKTIIKGLLISNPMTLTVRQLSIDFLEIDGRPIPYEKFGFSSLEEYLRSIPDTVLVHGRGPYAELEVVVTSKSEHINEMVLKQKKKIPRFKRPPRRCSSKHGYSPPKNVSYFNMHNSSVIFSMRHFQSNLDENMRYLNTKMNYGASPSSKQTNDTYLDKQDLNIEYPTYTETKCDFSIAEEDVQPTFEKESPVLDDKESTAEKQEDQDADLALLNNDKNDVVLSDEDYSTRIPFKIQKNLRTLIEQFPDGIECSKLPDEYRKMFNKKIRYDEYNYKSLIEMCSDLPEIFHFNQHSSDDYILYDSSKPVPSNCAEKNSAIEQERVQIENVAKTHILEEIRNLSWATASPLIPADVIRITDEITRCFPNDVAVGDLLDITVAEIYDLSKFWVYITYGELETLMKNLQLFFSDNCFRYVLPEALIEEGLYCVSLFAGRYHRCVIVKVLQNVKGFVRVFYFDYGTVENVSSTQLWFLPKQFAGLPAQAIRARLSNIYPVYENRPWCNEAVIRFEKSVTNRVIVAEVTKIDDQDHVLELYLADITNKNDIFYINDVMVKEGYALFSDQERKKSFVDYDCKPNVRYIHLYPQFYEIESGRAPTIEEMRYIVANKIPLHHYIPQYFEINFFEDIEAVEKQHLLLFKKMPEISTPSDIEYEFDLNFFAVSDLERFKQLYEEDNCDKNSCYVQTEASLGGTNDSPENYFCNKKRLSDIRQGKVLKRDKSESNANYSDANIFSSESTVDVTCYQAQSVVSLNNSFKKLDLSNDLQTTAEMPVPRTCTNPFLSDEYLNTANSLNTTNPFRTTNPFVTDLEKTVNRSELLEIFAKPSNDKLPEKIVNNLSDTCGHPCKEKNTNVERSSFLSTSGIFDSMGTTSSNNESTLSTDIPRVRTPPGFNSRNQNRIPFSQNLNCNFMPNAFSNNPYYHQFPNSQINNNPFFQQNYMNMSLQRPFVDPRLNYIPSMYLNQYRFNSPDWRQNFQQVSSLNFSLPSPYRHF